MSEAAQKQPIKMVNDRILVQIPSAEGERKSRGGILIPATAQVSKRLAWAEVVAVGSHVRSPVWHAPRPSCSTTKRSVSPSQS
jgi:chaperonin GroES